MNDNADGLQTCVIEGLSTAIEPLCKIGEQELNVNGKIINEVYGLNQLPKFLWHG